MSYIPRSHKYPMQCQDVVPRGLWECDDAAALAFAQENYDQDATIERWTDMKVGQVAIKNANCWHATINTTPQPRQALLVQYCRYARRNLFRVGLTPRTGASLCRRSSVCRGHRRVGTGAPARRSEHRRVGLCGSTDTSVGGMRSMRLVPN